MADNRKLAQGLMMMTPSARADLAQREGDIQRGKTVELLRRASKEMYDNPIVNTAIGFTPVLGDVQAAGETMAALNRGAPWQETAGYAAGMLPFVPMIGKTVWHGSPHSFEKFDLSKIGTGEGAQAYGHGLYLAEARPTAEGYANDLSKLTYKVGNEVFDPSTLKHLNVRARAWDGKLDEAIEKAKQIIQNNTPVSDLAKQDLAVLEKIKAQGGMMPNEGNLYKVDLPDEQIAKMLDWDKPMNQQSDYVLKQLGYEKGTLEDINREADALMQKYGDAATRTPEQNEAFYREYNALNERLDKLAPSISGGDYYRGVDESSRLHNMLGGYQGDAASSANLMQQGIPGIQYLDQASRGAGEGTRNYVVFSDEIPQILERNGQPVAQALREYKQLESLNPTGTVMTEYNPLERASLPLGKNLTTLDVTSGVSPDEMVEIYRGVPQGVSEISPGDFITTNRQLAQDYAGGGNVISQKVPYRTILDDLTEPLGEEYIYRP